MAVNGRAFKVAEYFLPGARIDAKLHKFRRKGSAHCIDVFSFRVKLQCFKHITKPITENLRPTAVVFVRLNFREEPSSTCLFSRHDPFSKTEFEQDLRNG